MVSIMIAYCWSGVRCSTSSASCFVSTNDNSLYIQQGRAGMMKNLKLKFEENLHSEFLNGNSRVVCYLPWDKKA